MIELCLFFKQICTRKLMQRDMEKAKEQLINIMLSLEQIYPPAFFDIMIHLVMHLLEEAILGGPVYMRCMYPFERYMKKLKNYVRNKSKPEGSIAEGYVAEEALTFFSHYLKGVETRFNHLDINGNFQTITWKQNFLAGLISRPRRPPHWKVIKDVHHRKIWYRDVVEDDQDVIHDSNSFDVALSANLGDLDYTILSTNDESTEVDAPPYNEVPDEESANFIGDEDDVVPRVLEDDDLDDDVRDDDDPASVHVVSSDDSSEDEN
ncbi:hypothetical protein Tco_0305507 [Tanacetum coccineum]